MSDRTDPLSFPTNSQYVILCNHSIALDSSVLQVILISDPTSEKGAASMSVNVGSFLDPEELPGLAHFLEHMLFLGTEKYPDENQYSSFLSEHGGQSNAYTSGLQLTNLPCFFS